MKRYHKIRWLSRWQTISVLCDSLESVFICFQEVDESKASITKFIFEKIGSVQVYLYLIFFANILHLLAMLSKVFQLKFVDIITVESIVRTEVAQICMMFIVDYCDLNVGIFNESTGYHILSNYDHRGGYLKRL